MIELAAAILEILDRGCQHGALHPFACGECYAEYLESKGDMMVKTNLKELGKVVLEINTANGWNVLRPDQWADTYKVPAVLALIHSEVSEALEAFRKDDKQNFEEELADVVIRVIDCSAGLGLDLDKAIAEKLEKNKKRGFRHGGKRV